MDGAQVQAPGQSLIEIGRVVDDARTGSTKRVARTNAQWKSELLGCFFAFEETLGCGLRRHGNTHGFHQVAEAFAVLGDFDCINIHTDHPYVVLLPNAHFITLNAQVQRRLPPHRRQHRINVGMLLKNLFDGSRFQRLEVHVVRHDRVGHDGRRVGIDEGGFDAFFAKGPQGLGSGIIKLASLSNDNRSTANEENRFDAFVFGHFFFTPLTLGERAANFQDRLGHFRGQNYTQLFILAKKVIHNFHALSTLRPTFESWSLQHPRSRDSGWSSNARAGSLNTLSGGPATFRQTKSRW